jgi:DNA repair exonuclease SbcCD ATPase subunit
MSMNEARQNQNQLMDLYNQQNQQYQTQNAAANAYQNQLGETYSNPDAYLNSPEALASRQLAMQKLLTQNAQAGRRTAGLPMQNQLMMNQLQNLAAYRQGLRSAATGAYASPTGLGSTLQAAQAQSPTGNLMAGLGSIFAPAAAYYMMG